MNTINNPYQAGTKAGEITLPGISGFAAPAFENALLKIVTNSGEAQFSLPTAKGDRAYWIFSQFVGGTVSGQVPGQGENCRFKAYGTGNAGDLLILADPTANSGAQAGMVRSTTGSHAPSSSDGTFAVLGIAEEVFVDGQDVKARAVLGSTVTF